MGVASTLFGREQRSELLQLERTLGIRMERMQADGQLPALKPEPTQVEIDRMHTNSASRMTRLPGEILQAQFAN